MLGHSLLSGLQDLGEFEIKQPIPRRVRFMLWEDLCAFPPLGKMSSYFREAIFSGVDLKSNEEGSQILSGHEVQLFPILCDTG